MANELAKDRRQLIETLAVDAYSRPYPMYRLWLSWMLLSVASVFLAMWLYAPFSSERLLSLLHSPPQLVASLSSTVAAVAFSLWAFQWSVPGARRLWLLALAVAGAVIWVAALGWDWLAPVMEQAIGEKRSHCSFEILLYSLPISGVGLWLLRRGYVLDWGQAGFYMGLAAGAWPAWLMQLVCLSELTHAMALHMPPVLVAAGIGGALGWWLGRR